MVSISFIGIHYYMNSPNNLNNNNNNNYKINLIPYFRNINNKSKPKNYNIIIYMENPKSINNGFTNKTYKYNIELLNETLPFNNYTVSLNKIVLKNISSEWYNYIKSTDNNEIVNYIANQNDLSMQVYAFTYINNNNTTYVYTYFNNILYNPLNIINNNYFNYSLNVYFNINNPTYVYNNSNNTTNNTNNPDYITPGPGSHCCVRERKACDYNNDHTYTQELNQTTYNNSYLPIEIMYLNDTDNNTDYAEYSNSISEFNSSQNVNFQFNDTTTYSKTDTVQSTTPSYVSPDLSVNDIFLVTMHNNPANIYGIPNSTLQITNYRPVTVTDYKYTVYYCYYKNGEEVKKTSKTYSEDHTDYGNPYATLKILSVGSNIQNVNFNIENKTQREYIYALGFYQYLLKNNTKILNKTIKAGDMYSISTFSLNVTTYTDAYNTLNRVLTGANLFLGDLGVDLAIMSVSAPAFDLGGAAGYALAFSSLLVAAGSLGVAIEQASQPISVANNINAEFNTITLQNSKNGVGATFNFTLYKSEYPEYIQYNGTYHAVYVPEPYIYVT